MGDHAHHGHGHGHNHDQDLVVEHRGGADGGIDISDTTATPGKHVHQMMMSMFFHTGTNETILFESWETTDVLGLLGSMLAIFFLAFLYEALKFYREHLYRHSFRTIQYNTVSVPAENGGTVKETQKIVQVRMLSLMHTWQTTLHVIQVILSYFLMLIFMTYNVWLCLAVVLGAGAGYFFFGWKKSLVVDITEHCH